METTNDGVRDSQLSGTSWLLQEVREKLLEVGISSDSAHEEGDSVYLVRGLRAVVHRVEDQAHYSSNSHPTRERLGLHCLLRCVVARTRLCTGAVGWSSCLWFSSA